MFAPSSPLVSSALQLFSASSYAVPGISEAAFFTLLSLFPTALVSPFLFLFPSIFFLDIFKVDRRTIGGIFLELHHFPTAWFPSNNLLLAAFSRILGSSAMREFG
jgi:hypothetical protein